MYYRYGFHCGSSSYFIMKDPSVAGEICNRIRTWEGKKDTVTYDSRDKSVYLE